MIRKIRHEIIQTTTLHNNIIINITRLMPKLISHNTLYTVVWRTFFDTIIILLLLINMRYIYMPFKNERVITFGC